MSFNVSLVIDSKAIVRIRKAAASYNSFNIGLASLQISNFRIGCRDFAFRLQAADCRRAGNVSIASDGRTSSCHGSFNVSFSSIQICRIDSAGRDRSFRCQAADRRYAANGRVSINDRTAGCNRSFNISFTGI